MMPAREARPALVALILLGTGLVTAWWLYGREMRQGHVFAPQHRQEVLFDEDFDDVVLGASKPFRMEGWSPGRWGLALQPTVQ